MARARIPGAPRTLTARGTLVSDKLLEAAKAYIGAFRRALVESDKEFLELVRGMRHGFSVGMHGTVVFTDEVQAAERELAKQATKRFGSERTHERSVREVARKVAFQEPTISDIRAVANSIVRGLAEAASLEHVVVRPNRLFRLLDGITELHVGPVRIVTRDLLNAERITADFQHFALAALDSDNDTHRVEADGETSRIMIHLPDICWTVRLNGMPKGVAAQALWMIDVAVSFIRLHYQGELGPMPRLQGVEPHPVFFPDWDDEGFIICPSTPSISFSTERKPYCYEVNENLAQTLNAPEVKRRAELLFNAPGGSLAEHMQQTLGWLTRGRRAYEPAERVLFFFTAIEALLSPGQGQPVTDTISRHSGVLWTNNPGQRYSIFKTVKKLNEIRSRIVHLGERSVAPAEANTVHFIAWNLACHVLKSCDLAKLHRDFLQELGEASFGTEWPMSDGLDVNSRP